MIREPAGRFAMADGKATAAVTTGARLRGKALNLQQNISYYIIRSDGLLARPGACKGVADRFNELIGSLR
jgi:hypothetical protein